MCVDGIGSESNYKNAMKWLLKAGETEAEDAKVIMDRLVGLASKVMFEIHYYLLFIIYCLFIYLFFIFYFFLFCLFFYFMVN